MKKSYIEENALERERMRALVESLSDEQLLIPLEDGWTIAVALAHLAFWDQRSLFLIRKWKENRIVEPSLRIPGHSGHRFRTIPATDSEGSRP